MPEEKFVSINYSSQYYNSIQYLYKKGLGDYLTSFVNNLYNKSDLFTTTGSPIYKSEILSLLEESLKYSIKDLNYDRYYTKIERFNTLKNISYLYNNIYHDKSEETLLKINETLKFYDENKSFLESKGIDESNLFFLLKLKFYEFYKIDDLIEKKKTIYHIINILFKFNNKIDAGYKDELVFFYVILSHDSYKTADFSLLLDLINKHNAEIPDFDLSEIKEMLETRTISEKQKTVEQILSDLENNKISEFKQKILDSIISYLIIPYGNINELKIKSSDEKKLVIHYYYIRYLLSKNSFWMWKNNPDYKLINEKTELSSFQLVYNNLHSLDIDIKFKDGKFDFLKAEYQIINEILVTNNPNKVKLIYTDFLDKINYEISHLETTDFNNDDEFIVAVLNNNINIFKEINSNYVDLISLLFLIYADIQKLTFGFDNDVKTKKIKKLKEIIKSKLNDEICLEDLSLRIYICYNTIDFVKIKDFVELNYKSKKISFSEYVKLSNRLNFLEFDIYQEQYLNIESNKTKKNSNDYLLVLATKSYNFFISNIDVFNDWIEYTRIFEMTKIYNFQPNLQLINKFLSFYNSPGAMLTNENRFWLDYYLGQLYYTIKNYPVAKKYFYLANANPLIFEHAEKATLKWEILMDIYFCTILDIELPKNEIKECINYIKPIFETDIERIKNIKSDNISNTLNQIIYKYNIIRLYEVREQKDLLKEKKILIEQLEIAKKINLNKFRDELALIKCKTKLNEISTTECLKLIADLYVKYNEKKDILFALLCEELKDNYSSFDIQLNTYSEELINNLKYINKLSLTNQINFFNEIWDHRQYILRTYFKLSEEEKQKNLNRLIDYFILSDNIDGNNSKLYSNNDSTKIDELILEKKKLFNTNLEDEDYNKISNNIDLLQQNLKFKESNINWNLQLLRDNLKENQAYIRIFSSNGYYAFIITKTITKLIDLNENNIDFQKAFNAYMMNLKEQNISALAYDIFYSKIFNALPKEANELFFQNEGVYINLNPDGFKSNSTQKYLIEDYDIHTINTSYSFNNLNSNVSFENALLIGNPKFQIEETTVKNTSIVSNNTRGTLSPLPNTQNEVIEVSKQLNNINIKTNCLLQNDATEENLNKLSASFDLIHIATHGFYKDAGAVEINTFDWGLYLTGALDYINNNQVNNKMIDEGIVYAPEIELLNLSKTKLVVLSACETGFGRQSKIGKISLSSSFIMAGAKNVLSTLWKVDDKVTMEFINTFYKKLLQLKNIKNALRQTQLEFLEKYKSPYFWAPFMLLQNRG